MRLFPLIFVSLFALCGCDNQTSSLTIVHTNDVHAHLLPSDMKLQDCEVNQTDCYGGYARIKSIIDGVRQSAEKTLVLDAGDRFSGSVFYTLRKSEDITPLTQQLGYDVLTLGNHEFDDGLGELAKFTEGISAPIVSANVSFPTHPMLNKRVVPSVILNKDGLRIGVIGALSEDTKSETAKAQDVDIFPVIHAVQQEAEKLIQQGINVLIALTHIGIDEDKKLALAVPQLDIIVGAHSHTLLSNDDTETTVQGPYPIEISHNDGNKTLIVTSGIAGHHVGILNASFDKQGRITSYTGDTVRLDDASASDDKIARQINAVAQQIDKIINEPIMNTRQNIHLTGEGRFCSESCYVGEFLTDMLKQRVDDADIVLLNAGGIRAGLPRGQLSFKHIASAYPFDSTGVLIQMTGAELKSYLEYGLQKYVPDDRTNAFLQIAGGAYTFSPITKTISSLTVHGKAVEAQKTYTVLIPSFMAEGGDGFPVKQAIKMYDLTIRDMIIRAMKEFNNTIKPFENRIKKVK